MGEIIRQRSDGRYRSIEAVNAGYLSEYVSRFHCPLSDHSPTNRRIIKASKVSSKSLKSWWNDPERKRQRRISSYKYYSAEANVKNTFKNGLRWLGKKCSLIIRRF